MHVIPPVLLDRHRNIHICGPGSLLDKLKETQEITNTFPSGENKREWD